MVNSQISRVVIFSIVLLTGITYAVSFFYYGYIHGDEGFALMNGWRIALGERPYLDFYGYLPPFSFLPTALFFTLFGANFLAARLLVLAYALLLVISADMLLSRLTRNFLPRITLAIYLIPFGVMHWPIPSHHWTVTITQLLCLAWLLQGLVSNPARYGFLAGIMAALGVFSMQDQGGYLVIALVVLFFPWIKKHKTRRSLFIAWIAGGLVTTAAMLLYLLAQVPISTLIDQWILFPLERYKQLAGNQSNLANLGLQQIGTQPWVDTLLSFPDYTIPQTLLSIALPLLAPLAVIILWRRYIKKLSPNAETGLLLAGVLAFSGGALHLFSQTYLIWAAPMFLVVIFHGLDRLKFSARKLATVFLLAVILLSGIYCVGRYRLTHTMPLVKVSGPAGSLYVPPNSTQSSMQVVLDAIEQYVPANAPLIVTKYNPIINFWSQRRNPAPLNMYIWPDFHTREQAIEMIQALKDNPATHVLLFIPARPADPFAEYVLSHYRISWRAPWALLMSPYKPAPKAGDHGG